MKKNLAHKKIENKELNDVSGGTCYTSKTYGGFGLTDADLGTGQILSYHPVITTWGNRCGGWEESESRGGSIEDCFHCTHLCKPSGGLKSICLNRSKERDDYK